MNKGGFVLVAVVMLITASTTHGQQIELSLQMPGSLFGPGSLFLLNLDMSNTGPDVGDTELYVVLAVGESDFWFYPGWTRYPESIDSLHLDIPGQSEQRIPIIPELQWPNGLGSFQDARFYAVVISGGHIASNLAEFSFGWTEESPDQIFIPAGSLSPKFYSNICSDSDDYIRTLTNERPFFIMPTEVTRQIWSDLMETQPTLPADPSNCDVSPSMRHPVQSVTWFEAVLFANLLSIDQGYRPCYYIDPRFNYPVDVSNYIEDQIYYDFSANGYRLPTTREWEYACRAGTSTVFPFDEPGYTENTCDICAEGIHPVLEQYAVYCANAHGGAEPVGSRLPNQWNLFDMLGNVSEWCWDWYYPNYVNTEVAPDGSERYIRGGNWIYPARFARSSSNPMMLPATRYACFGFRLVRTYVLEPSHYVPTYPPNGEVFISPGTFVMGSPDDEPCRYGSEGPLHQVTLTRGFYMMRTEVTRGMWEDLQMSFPEFPDDPSRTSYSPTRDYPVVYTIWEEAILFANFLSFRDGFAPCYYADIDFTEPIDEVNYLQGTVFWNRDSDGYCLPTEAQWEYACRAGTTGPFSFTEPRYSSETCINWKSGLLPIMELYCVFHPNNPLGPRFAGSKRPNPWGLYDMYGNVSEWCWDRYGNYVSGTENDPIGPESGDSHVVRGGEWYSDSRGCRSASRYGSDERNYHGGFRLVRFQ